jgi:hypothetical protein
VRVAEHSKGEKVLYHVAATDVEAAGIV